MARVRILAVLFAVLALVACEEERPRLWESDNLILPLPARPLGVDAKLTEVKVPLTPERIRLGRWLFFDARLSGDNGPSCASCHKPEHGYSQTEPQGTLVTGKKTTRKTPTFINQAWNEPGAVYWDGRAPSFEQALLGSIGQAIATADPHAIMVDGLLEVKSYRAYFAESFGTPEITRERAAKALADFLRSRMSGDSPWDRWKRIGDQKAVADDARRGDALFFGKAGCAGCHGGQHFSDFQFHNIGVGWIPSDAKFVDEGRYAVTKADADRGAFKTPTLRDVALRAPYMHDGSASTLAAAVRAHDRGWRANPFLDARIGPFTLTDTEVADLVKFLEALTSKRPADMGPEALPKW